MSAFVEKLFDALFALVNGYESIRAGTSDDPVSEEYKSLQRSVIASFLWTIAVIIVGFGATGLLSNLEGNATFSQLAEALRPPLGAIVIGTLGLTLLWFTYTAVRLALFIRKHDLTS